MTAVLTVEHLCKAFGTLKAVDDVSFSVKLPGEIVGLVGPNGAGKTTTINMVLGVLAPDAGRVEIDGIDLGRDRSRARSAPPTSPPSTRRCLETSRSSRICASSG